ncbi:hypothetical protein [Streptomyces beigongshangae]|uniref:hypothetical protein n=1 Tax=Streptomyces beigongshangae TaxID=2841597 RepID=UPI001C8598ED|nr:hypothetical protein [Streptomyces sp. REN17]
MNRPARRLPPVGALLLGAVTAAALGACSDHPRATPAAGPAPARTSTPAPVPTSARTPAPASTPGPADSATATTRPPLTADPSYIANNVVLWWRSGGETELISVIDGAAHVQDLRTRNGWTYDFGRFFDSLDRARAYGPVPDRRTQASWAAALRQLDDGAGDVYRANRHGMSGRTRSPGEVRLENRGWRRIGAGVEQLKATERRLHRAFALVPRADAWQLSP